MRIDKFLKLARIVKRRTLAQEMIELGAVRFEGRAAKPSTFVRVGGTIEIAFPKRVLEVRVMTVDEKEIKRGICAFELISERAASPDTKPW